MTFESIDGSGDEDVREPEFPPEAEFLKDAYWHQAGTYWVPGVAGESGRLVHGFTPSRYELEVLACHYLERIHTYRFEWEVGGQASSSGRRFVPFAAGRLKTLEGFIGEERSQEILCPIDGKWEALLAHAKDRCRAKGVDHPHELDEADFLELLGKGGFVAIPVSELHPMDELLDGGSPSDKA